MELVFDDMRMRVRVEKKKKVHVSRDVSAHGSKRSVKENRNATRLFTAFRRPVWVCLYIILFLFLLFCFCFVLMLPGAGLVVQVVKQR